MTTLKDIKNTYALYSLKDEIGIITLNRPERLNAISGELLHDFKLALTQAIEASECRVIILHGQGRAFCSGDDLKEFAEQSASEAASQAHISAIQEITRLMMTCQKPIIGAIHGYAVGGAFEWLVNCDLVVAADDLKAFFPEMQWANFVTGGISYLLPLTVGHSRAMELILLGEEQTAQRLLDFGLVNWVVPKAQMLDKAWEVAKKLTLKSSYSMGAFKTLVYQTLGDELWKAVQAEEQITIQAFMRPEAAERVQTFFNPKKA
jgi:enoyl-CoA hydratase/carnithine racemase